MGLRSLVRLVLHLILPGPSPRADLMSDMIFMGETCPRTRFILAETLVLNGTAGAGRMTPPTSTSISARMTRVQEHSSRVNTSQLNRPVI